MKHTLDSRFFSSKRVMRRQDLKAGRYIRVFIHSRRTAFNLSTAQVIGKPYKQPKHISKSGYVFSAKWMVKLTRLTGMTYCGIDVFGDWGYHSLLGIGISDTGTISETRLYRFSHKLLSALKAAKAASLSDRVKFITGKAPIQMELTVFPARSNAPRGEHSHPPILSDNKPMTGVPPLRNIVEKSDQPNPFGFGLVGGPGELAIDMLDEIIKSASTLPFSDLETLCNLTDGMISEGGVDIFKIAQRSRKMADLRGEIGYAPAFQAISTTGEVDEVSSPKEGLLRRHITSSKMSDIYREHFSKRAIPVGSEMSSRYVDFSDSAPDVSVGVRALVNPNNGQLDIVSFDLISPPPETKEKDA